jgi:hypothetical protein
VRNERCCDGDGGWLGNSANLGDWWRGCGYHSASFYIPKFFPSQFFSKFSTPQMYWYTNMMKKITTKFDAPSFRAHDQVHAEYYPSKIISYAMRMHPDISTAKLFILDTKSYEMIPITGNDKPPETERELIYIDDGKTYAEHNYRYYQTLREQFRLVHDVQF